MKKEVILHRHYRYGINITNLSTDLGIHIKTVCKWLRVLEKEGKAHSRRVGNSIIFYPKKNVSYREA